MKKVLCAVSILALLSLSSCGVLAGSSNTQSTSSNSNGFSIGSTIGSILKVLLELYVSNGSLNMKDPTTLLNLATLATSYSSVQDNLSNQTVYDNVAKGIVSGSQQKVTEANVGTILTALQKLDFAAILGGVNSDGTMTATATTSNTLNKAGQTMTDIMKIMTQK